MIITFAFVNLFLSPCLILIVDSAINCKDIEIIYDILVDQNSWTTYIKYLFSSAFFKDFTKDIIICVIFAALGTYSTVRNLLFSSR